MRTILIVEDDLNTSRLLSTIIETMGYTVLNARNAGDGIAMARQHHPAIILMDLRLPGITGWEATRMLKADDTLAHIPVFALTAQVTPEDIERAFAAGCVEYISKPFELKNLSNMIQRYMHVSH